MMLQQIATRQTTKRNDAEAARALPLASAETRTAAKADRTSPVRFLLWCAISFAGTFALVWVYVATMPMAFLSRDYPLLLAKNTMLGECKAGAIAVFGDSRAVAAITPSAMPVPVVNFAMSGTSPIETYFNVARALRCATPPKAVVIAHSLAKFMGDSDYWNFSARTGFLSFDEMRSVDADAARLNDPELKDLARGEPLPLSVRERLFSLRFPSLYFDSLVSAVFGARWFHNNAAMHDNLQSSGHALFGTGPGSSEVAGDATIDKFVPSPLEDLYFTRTLSLLAERGIPAVFLPMPVNHATYVRLQPGLEGQFSDYLQAKAGLFPGLRIIGPAIPCWPDRFFGDFAHLNALGAQDYSETVGRLFQTNLDAGKADYLAGRCLLDEADQSRDTPGKVRQQKAL